VLYAVLDLALDRVRIASAGHLPPVVAGPGEAGSLVDISGGLMIGVDPQVQRQVTTVKIAHGAVLCLYTDGLVERREHPLDEGLARLCGAVVARPPEEVCVSVMGALVGGTSARDDVALLTLQRLPPGSPGT